VYGTDPLHLRPVWDPWSTVLAVELEDAPPVPRDDGPYRSPALAGATPRRLLSLVHDGDSGRVIRRVTPHGIHWEHQTHTGDGPIFAVHYGRAGRTLLLPCVGGGLRGIDYETGDTRWEVLALAGMIAPPLRDRDGAIMLFHTDGVCLRLHPDTGDVVEKGKVAPEDLARMVGRGVPLARRSRRQRVVVLPECVVQLGPEALIVQRAAALAGRPPDLGAGALASPRDGEYRFDSWRPSEHLQAVAEGIVVGLTRAGRSPARPAIALGLLDPGTLALRHLVPLGEGHIEGGYEVDGLVAIKALVSDRLETHLVDPRDGRRVGALPPSPDPATFPDPGDRPGWSRPL
jgi:hypothetical protein